MLEPKPKKLQMLGKFASVQPDWDQRDENAVDYIKNKPFYEYIDIGDVFVEEQTFTHDATRGGHTIMTDINRTPASGQTFCITFDGVEYCLDVGMCQGPNDSNQEYFIGNASIRYPELGNNGLPFYLYITYWGVYVFMVYTTSGEHTIKIVDAVRTVKQLPEGAIPDTIARKTDIPEQVQSDWNQNDETAIDYVKNRTHYMTLVEVPIEGTLAYDGVHVSCINGEYNLHKLCEVEGKPEEYQIKIYSATNTNKVIDIADMENDCSEYFVEYGPGYGWLTVREHIDGERYNLYVGSASDDTYNGIPFSGSVFVNQAQPLDEKYIPDTIARKTDIPTDIPTDTHINGLINTALSNVNRTQVQSDWAQLDETAVDYIKNKPFGESMHIGEALFDKATVEKDSSTVKISNFAVFDIRLDKYYYVVFDNIEYCCKSVSYSGRRWLGNLVYAYPFKDNTGEPFLIEYNYVAGVSTSRYLYCEDNSHTIQIFDAEYDVIPIAEKYITNNVRYRPVKVPLFERVLKTGFTGYSGAYYIRLDDSEQIDSGFTDGWLYLKNNYYRVTVDEYFDVLYNDGEVIHTASVYIDKDSLGTRLCTNSASAPFTLDNEPVRIYSMDGVEPVILPDECVPDTIARKSEIPEQVQADWNQAYETSVDYVKNRTHYENITEEAFFNETGTTFPGDGYLYMNFGTVYAPFYEGTLSISNTTVLAYKHYDFVIDKPFMIDAGEVYVTLAPNDSGYSIHLCATTSGVLPTKAKLRRLRARYREIKQLDSKYLPKAAAVPDAAGDTPTAAEFNALLTALRNAGYLADS